MQGGKMGPTYVCNFYLVKNQKVTNSPLPTKLEKNKRRFESLKNLYVWP